jgi:hypothetical protein
LVLFLAYHDTYPVFDSQVQYFDDIRMTGLPIIAVIDLNYITNFIKLSPSLKATSCEAIKELPSNLWNWKVHYRVHKILPLVLILSQIDPVRTTPSYLSKIHFNIVTYFNDLYTGFGLVNRFTGYSHIVTTNNYTN